MNHGNTLKHIPPNHYLSGKTLKQNPFTGPLILEIIKHDNVDSQLSEKQKVPIKRQLKGFLPFTDEIKSKLPVFETFDLPESFNGVPVARYKVDLGYANNLINKCDIKGTQTLANGLKLIKTPRRLCC
jgi:hypothetical protein